MRTVPLVLATKLAIFMAMGSHRGWWRYATFADIVKLAEAATLSSLVIFLINQAWITTGSTGIPRSIILLDWATTLLLFGAIRGSTRLLREYYYPMLKSQDHRRTLVVGSSEVGVALVRELQSRPGLGMRVLGLLDPNASMKGRVVAGVRVLGRPDEIGRFASRKRIDLVLIATPSVPVEVMRTLVSDCNEVGVKVQVVPSLDALLTGSLTVQPRDVDIEDLLCREPVTLDTEAIGRFLRDRVVLVTGAAGSIGSELCRQSLNFQPKRLILLDHSENGMFAIERELRERADSTEIVARVASITDARRLRAIFEKDKPEVVFHAAAHKHVPMMEMNVGEAIKNNIIGSCTLVDEAVAAGAEALVMISTDKAVNPSSVMGVCKRVAEMYVQALSDKVDTRLVTVRFGNVLGSNGSVVPVFKEQIRRGGPVTVTHPDVTRYFMTIPEATQLVLQAGTLGSGGEIFVLDMGQPIKVADLAQDLIRLSGFQDYREIEIVYTGLRPGEKLYEELYDPRERRLPTPHPKIFKAQHRQCSLDWLRLRLKELSRSAETRHDELVALLQEIVPEYQPKRSDAAEAVATPSDPSREPPLSLINNILMGMKDGSEVGALEIGRDLEKPEVVTSKHPVMSRSAPLPFSS
ncbi:polysaccharide biosynthesis protein [Singulisphaera sp. PoT]|uniref:polysaccharide biosynthesis protein n=1 Tax=Singulisphaera sp. PoT TaxID=3411797 RepID=UPI003BF4649F